MLRSALRHVQTSRPARRAARSDALRFACLGPNSRAVQGRGVTRPKCLLLPLDFQPDFALPGVGVAIEADIVIDVAVEARGVTDRHGRADAERRPAVAGVDGERDKAGGGRELRCRVIEEFVPDVGAAP